MARTKLHRKEQNGEWIVIGTAVFYINDAGKWRETTKAEMDVFQIQIDVADSAPVPLQTNTMFPDPATGEDGDYYALIYPVGWDGPVWNDTPLTP